MRAVTRNLIIGIGVVLVLLLALGVLPSLLKSGDPYYVSATQLEGNVSADSNATGSSNGNATGGPNATVTTGPNATAVNASALSAQTHPFTTAALADAGPNRTGYSGPYWKGPVGIKGAFTHSPFDELASMRQRTPNATDGEAVRVLDNGTLYRVGVTQDRP